jgi:hypothetical protein
MTRLRPIAATYELVEKISPLPVGKATIGVVAAQQSRCATCCSNS